MVWLGDATPSMVTIDTPPSMVFYTLPGTVTFHFTISFSSA